MHRRHVVAANQRPRSVFKRRVSPDQHDRAKADNKGQDIEVAHKTGSVEDALTRLAGVANGKEAHQDMRQPGSTEHQAQAEGEGRDRILHQPAGTHDGFPFRMYRHRFAEQVIEAEADMLHDHKGHKAGTKQQQHRLDNLYPCRGQHAAEQHVHHHQHAYQHHRNVVVEAEQQLDQLACADHLGNQIERDHHQRAAGRKDANRPLLQTVGGDVGKGKASEVTQAFGDQEQNNWPADEEAERVDQTVVARGINQRGDTKERGGGHEVTCDRQPVLEASNIAACGVVIITRAYAL